MAASLRIGSGSAWWGDRIDPARLNAEHGRLDYLCFETMAESTISAAQLRARRDPQFPGYDTWLDERMQAVLPGCMAHGTRIVSNQGWINPHGAARRIVHWLREMGHRGVKVAAVGGGMITDQVLALTDTVLETGAPTRSLAETMVCAEVYLGAEPIVDALKQGARIVVTGRVADPSLFLAPMMFEFGWDPLDHARVGAGSGIGHLMECGAQVTGGYFADPGFKDVPQPWNLAFPIAEVEDDGSAVITKLPGTGGAVNLMTVKEQILYEVHDPGHYITPDVVVDFTTTQLEQQGEDRVRVHHVSGKPRTPTLKVSISCAEGFMGEDMFFYAGPGALRRANLARRILQERFRIVGLDADDVRSGDKGNICNIAVIAYHARLYPHLKAQLGAQQVKAFYAGAITGEVQRYAIDSLWALNFVAHGALGGGVSRNLSLDQYGKAMSAALLGFELQIPQQCREFLRGMG